MATILVVDDRPENREFLARLLGEGGHRLFEASDGSEALAMAEAERPDLIISDILMPTIDGYEFVRQLRSRPLISQTRVIFCTASDHEPEARRLAQACGVEHIILKPAEPAEILSVIDRALGAEAPLPQPRSSEEFDRDHRRLLTDNLACKVNELEAANAELRKTMERLRAAQEQVRLQASALEAAADGVIISDRSGKIVWVNRAFCKLTGYTLEEAVGQNPRFLKSGQHDEAFYRGLWKTILAGRIWQGEMVNRRKDGSLYPEAMTVTPLMDATGTITHFIAIKQDITERKRAEAEIRTLNAELEQRVLARTKALAAANEELHLLNRQKDEFLSIVSHDLRSPLGGIQMIAEMMLKMGSKLPSDKQRDLMKSVHDTAQHVIELVSELLALAKIEAGHTKLDLSELRIGDVVRDSIQALSFNAKSKEISIGTQVPGDQPPLRADRLKLLQIFNNLLSNAIKFTPKGGRVTVSVQPADGGVRVSVADTGQGIAPEFLPQIFEKFSQGRSPGTEGEQSTGLGLAIVRQLVELHGGRIEVSSEVNRGTTFTVFLPQHVNQTDER